MFFHRHILLNKIAVVISWISIVLCAIGLLVGIIIAMNQKDAFYFAVIGLPFLGGAIIIFIGILLLLWIRQDYVEASNRLGELSTFKNNIVKKESNIETKPTPTVVPKVEVQKPTQAAATKAAPTLPQKPTPVPAKVVTQQKLEDNQELKVLEYAYKKKMLSQGEYERRKKEIIDKLKKQ